MNQWCNSLVNEKGKECRNHVTRFAKPESGDLILMAEMATYIGSEPRAITASAAIARGLRCSLNSGGTCDLQDDSAVGDYVALHDIEAGKRGAAAGLYDGGKVPAVASEAVAVGDPAYIADNGRFSKTEGTILLGTWSLGASAGALGEVELGR